MAACRFRQERADRCQMFPMRWAKRICLVLLVALAAGCGSRSAKVAEPDRGTWADELVRQGCYDCLLDAKAAYERLAGSSAAALARVFEIDLLLALREKELSIDTTATLAHAESLIPRLTGLGPPEGGHYVRHAERLLAIVRIVPEDAAGLRLLPPTKEAAPQIESAIADINASPFSAEFKSYVRLSIECGRITANPVPAPGSDMPLLLYRRAICVNPVGVSSLRAIRSAVPRFVEASFFLGRVAKG